MKIDAGIGSDLNKVAEQARYLEDTGYDGLMTIETGHDPFLPLTIAAEHTSSIELRTSIAVAFARNPMLLANLGHDLNSYSKGRFCLGLGSQIKPHITRRFSMPWSKPAARMKEMVQAMHAIWDCWYDDAPLKFEGEFYTHNIMTPYFTPTDTDYGRPKVHVAAVGPKMTEAAAQVADGMLCHSFTTERYMREITVPTIEKTLKATGRRREDFQISYPMFVVTSEKEEEFAAIKDNMRGQIAFYGSTPAYRGVLELHGWNDLHPELHRMSKAGKWEEMGTLIDDEILDTFAVVGEPHEVVSQIKARFSDVIDRTTLHFPGVDKAKIPGLLQQINTA